MLRIHLLGECEIHDSRRGRIKLRRRESALMALSCSGRAKELTRDAIAAMLWPAVPLPDALHSLRQALHRLGQLIPGAKGACRDGRINLHLGRGSSDLADFQAALVARNWSRAAALYAGPFLGTFALDEAPEFSHWVDGIRRHLERQAANANRRLLEQAEDSGQWRKAQEAARGLLAIDPQDEESLVAFVTIALRGGEWVEAERALAGALAATGATPKPGSVLGRLGNSVAEARSGRSSQLSAGDPPMIGRGAEATHLRETLQHVQDGRMRALLVRGTAGVGKTRLCQNALRVAAVKGFRVIACAGRQLASDIPLSVFSDLMAQVEGAETGHDREFEDGQVACRTRSPARLSQPDQLPREVAFSAAVETLRALTRNGPLALFIDDVQWIDGASADFLLFAMPRLRDEPLLVLLGLRPEDAAESAAVRAFMRNPRIEQLALGDLSVECAHELVRSIAERANIEVPDSIARQCISKSGGHPFFLIECLRGWQLAGAEERERIALPDSVQQLISTRCAGLSHAATQVAEALALFDGVVQHELLARVAALDVGVVAEAIQELSDRAFVRDSHEGALFVHDLVREAVAARVVAARQQVLHRRAARALSCVRPVPLAETAVHADLGGDRVRAWKYATAAAANVQQNHGCLEAEPLWRVALRNASSAGQSRRTKERLAECLYSAGKREQARKLYGQLLLNPELTGSRRMMFQAMALPSNIGAELSETALVELLSEVIAAPATNDKTTTLIHLLTIVTCERNVHIASQLSSALVAYAHEAPDDPAALFYMNHVSVLLAFLGDWDRVDRLQARALDVARRLSTSWWHACALSMQGSIAYLRGACRESAERFREAEQLFGSLPGRFEPTMFRLNWGVLLTEMADFARAGKQLESVLNLAQASSEPRFAARAAANLVALYYEAGDANKAVDFARTALDASVESQPGFAAIVYGVMGLLAADAVEERTARAGLRDVLSYRYPFGDDFSYAYAFLARASEREGKWHRAKSLLDRGIGMYAGRDFFCHGRLQLEKARLLASRDVAAAVALAREVRARAADAEAVLLLNKSEALIRQLRREGASVVPGREARPNGSPARRTAAVRLVAERARGYPEA